ncbi:type 4 prepilin-like proteins leader peptide-processing enzyme [Marinobacterium nitratireducens]|uniref:Prepilin leader peptidase/N-methyltransferase n=1 Tax=Marinobacterium nitratireducens TaxID=518897 RepID=A0A918DU72_9GAMM|nr:A24 family peptidase [Marinobacterium nitratireducens]GGO82485.1 type 4 prepilin-like proteins leader peptide-processing enzyme [Marinobacterium nitratireducens]
MHFEFLADTPAAAIALAFVFSLLVGSFLNVVIYRLPLMMEREWQAMAAEHQTDDNAHAPEPGEPFNLAVPASSCPQCGHHIRWYENIPLISYLALRGRCSGCATAIPLRYPLVELLTGVTSALVIWHFGLNTQGISLMLLSWGLIALSFIDLDHQLLPDRITLPLLWLGLILNSFELFTSLQSALWGAVIGYLSFWSIYWIFKLLTGKEGMGYGDFKLLAALGAWCGAQQLPLIILLSSVVGVALALILMLLRRHQAANPLPFGPYLAIAGWIAVIWGPEITGAYLGMF